MSYVSPPEGQGVDQKHGPVPPQQPPPYSSAQGPYSSAPGPYSSAAGPYSSAPGSYSSPPPGSYPVQAGHPQTAYYDPNGPPGQQPYYQQQPLIVQLPPTHGVMMQQVGEIPFRTTCPHCHAEVLTSVEYVTGGLTWLIFGILLAAGCFIIITWFFCCIPFCIKSCKDVVHSCPNCHTKLGRKNRM
jgi:lipopolysaccharide-induced tumor necrosis factor-alpha factor